MKLEQRCDACNATGNVTSPDWEAHWARKDAETAGVRVGPEPIRTEEWMCGRCMGRGTVLTKDGQAIAALVHRILDEAVRRERAHNSALDDARQRADFDFHLAQCLRDTMNATWKEAGG